MININLLDWREQKKTVNNNRFISIAVVVAVISMLSAYLSISFYVNVLNNKEDDIKYLRREIEDVEAKISRVKDLQEQRKVLLERRKLIDSLQYERVVTVNILDSLANAMQDGVRFSDLVRTNDDLLIQGMSSSNEKISVLLRLIQGFSWVKDASLTKITAATEAKYTGFTNFEIKVVVGQKEEKKSDESESKSQPK